jgi:pilus assembly protein CpaF
VSLLKRLEKEKGNKIIIGAGEVKIQTDKNQDPHGQFKAKVHEEIIEEVDNIVSGEEMSSKVEELVNAIIDRDGGHFTRLERQKITAEILDEVVGLGPIEQLLKDGEISEIMVNGPKHIYVERNGRIEQVNYSFRNNEHVLHIIDKIVLMVLASMQLFRRYP